MEFRKDLFREEKLANLVRKYPCLYDKNDKHYRDVAVRQRAWSEVAIEMDFATDEEAEIHWVNLRTRFTRQRKAAKFFESSQEKALNDGVMTNPTTPNLDVYHLLSWLDEFVLSRKRLSNTDKLTAKTEQNAIDAEGNNTAPAVQIICSNSDSYNDNRRQYPNKTDLRPDESATQVVISSHLIGTKNTPTTIAAGVADQLGYGEYHGGAEKLAHSPSHLEMKGLRENTPTPRFKATTVHQHTGPRTKAALTTAASHLRHKDEDDLFGDLLASQLKNLSDHNRLQAKHQINNIMFQIQMQQLNASQYNSQPAPGEVANGVSRAAHHNNSEEDSCENCSYTREIQYQSSNACYNSAVAAPATTHYVRVLDDVQAQDYLQAKDSHSSSPHSNNNSPPPPARAVEYRQQQQQQAYAFKRKRDS
eukprot:gene7441-8263_t